MATLRVRNANIILLSGFKVFLIMFSPATQMTELCSVIFVYAY